eukprot:304733_1
MKQSTNISHTTHSISYSKSSNIINQIKFTQHKPMNTSNVSKTCIELYLVNGYIRENYTTCSYPTSLSDMITDYIGCIAIKFDTYFTRNKRFIFDNGTRFCRDSSLSNQARQTRMFMVGCSWGWSAGINEFKIRIIKPQKDAIGIIEDVNECLRLQNWIRQSKVRVYILWGGGELLTGCNQFATTIVDYGQRYQWKQNDIIKVVLNCYQWKVYFFVNNRIIGYIKVAANRTYYPVLGSGYDNTEYQFVD